MTITVEALKTILQERLQKELSVGVPYSLAHLNTGRYLMTVARAEQIAKALAELENLTQEDIDNTIVSNGTPILWFVQQVVANKLSTAIAEASKS